MLEMKAGRERRAATPPRQWHSHWQTEEAKEARGKAAGEGEVEERGPGAGRGHFQEAEAAQVAASTTQGGRSAFLGQVQDSPRRKMCLA